MKKLYGMLLCGLLLFGLVAVAQDQISAGTTPDSAFYFLDTFGEKISLAFTFNKEAKAEKALKIAEEKLSEAEAMADKDKMEHAEKAQTRYENAVQTAEQVINQLEATGTADKVRARIQTVARIQEKIETHAEKIAAVKDTILERKAETMTSEQYAHLEEVFTKIKEKAAEMESEADETKEVAVIKYKEVSGMDETAIESEIRQIDTETGLTAVREVRAQNAITAAEAKLTKAQDQIMEKLQKQAAVATSEQEMEQINIQLMTVEAQLDIAKAIKESGDFKSARAIADEIKETGNAVSVIAVQLGDADNEGEFEQLKAQLRAAIEERHMERLQAVSTSAPQVAQASIQNAIAIQEEVRDNNETSTGVRARVDAITTSIAEANRPDDTQTQGR